MSDRSPVQDFLDAYRAAFEAFDVPAIADLFSYPCQITGEAGEISVMAVPTREAFVPQLERLVSAYRAIGVRSAEVLESGVRKRAPGPLPPVLAADRRLAHDSASSGSAADG
jgi:hypothetical protein